MTTDTDVEKAEEVHCHDCGMIASSPEEARANVFCHVKVFDARRRVVVGVGDDEDQQEEAAGRPKDGYYWLCPSCFHHMRETLLVVGGGDLSDKFSHRCRQDLEKEKKMDGLMKDGAMQHQTWQLD
jgi:hypothetical protein